MKKTKWMLAAAAAVGALWLWNSFSPRLIPRSILFGNPAQANPQVSPDGQWIAYLAPYEGVLNIWVQPRTGGKAEARTRVQDRGISNYIWASDSSHLLFFKDQQGNENTHLFKVSSQDFVPQDLTPFPGVRAQILAVEKNIPDDLILTLNRENPKFEDVYRLNWKTGNLELVEKNDGTVAQWVVDSRLQVRARLVAGERGELALQFREKDKAEWRNLLTWGLEDNFNSRVVSFSQDGESLYLVDSRNYSSGRLVRLDLSSGQTEVIAEDPDYDVLSVLMHPDKKEPQAVEWFHAKRVLKTFDSDLAADYQVLEKEFGNLFTLVSRDDRDQIWIVRVESDIAPVAYYVYDRRTKRSRFLFEHQPALKKYQLASMEPFSFEARDGLQIQGYLTFPQGKERKNLPLVLKVHGGPWNRDVWGFDSRAQWLANRGYLCMQVNFRGSTSYGKSFLNAGNKEWGGKMQHDLTDAVAWAVQQGYANPERMAIFGGSYGGYAALSAAAFTPDLFKAAVAVVGPSNLISFIQTTPAYWAADLENIYLRVGHPEKDAGFLKSRSPLFSVNQIKTPLLIAQGANDPRVKKSESDQIVEALKKHGIQHEYLLFEDEGHGFAKPENQMLFFKTAENFLARYLGGKAER